MQLEKEELIQLLKIISIVLKEAKWDFSPSSNFAVININGNCCTMYKDEIGVLNKIKNMLEGDVKW